MTILEAMFNGIPVVATAVGGSQEAVLHGVTGYLYSINDKSALEEHIMNLYQRKRDRNRMGKMALERANQYFHIDSCAECYWELFNAFVLPAAEPKCSVVMPVYNGADTVLDAIDSVLHQTMPYFEFIIVNDGSEDNTLALLREKAALDDRIRVIHQPHTGIVGALNHGIREARTDIIARIDADDEMLPTRLEKQLAYMLEHPDVGFCATNIIHRLPDGTILRVSEMPLSHEGIVEGLKTRNVIAHPSVLFRKKLWQAAGGYKGDGRCEDYILWTDAAVMGIRFAAIEEPLTIYGLSHHEDRKYRAWVDGAVEGIALDFVRRLSSRSALYAEPQRHIPLYGG